MTGLNTLLAVRRTKGPSKSREELAGCGPAQPRRRQKAEGGERGRLGPKDRSPHPLQTGLQFLTKDLLRFWVLDSRREGRSETGRRPPTGAGGDWGWECGGEKAHTPDWHGQKLRLGPRKGEGAPHPGRVSPSSSWLPELLGWGRHKMQAAAFCSVLLWNPRGLEPRAAQGTLRIEQPGA